MLLSIRNYLFLEFQGSLIRSCLLFNFQGAVSVCAVIVPLNERYAVQALSLRPGSFEPTRLLVRFSSTALIFYHTLLHLSSLFFIFLKKILINCDRLKFLFWVECIYYIISIGACQEIFLNFSKKFSQYIWQISFFIV